MAKYWENLDKIWQKNKKNLKKYGNESGGWWKKIWGKKWENKRETWEENSKNLVEKCGNNMGKMWERIQEKHAKDL